MLLMFLIVFAASVTAFCAASFQPFGELPINSIIFTTGITLHLPVNNVVSAALQLFDSADSPNRWLTNQHSLFILALVNPLQQKKGTT
jgi:hypothetical protein